MHTMPYSILRCSRGGESPSLNLTDSQDHVTELFRTSCLFVSRKNVNLSAQESQKSDFMTWMELIKILKRRHLNGKFLLFKIKGQILLLPVLFGSTLHSCQLYSFLYNRAWRYKKKTDCESENLILVQIPLILTIYPWASHLIRFLWSEDHRITTILLLAECK